MKKVEVIGMPTPRRLMICPGWSTSTLSCRHQNNMQHIGRWRKWDVNITACRILLAIAAIRWR
jgi:hypothetical protein